jgi:hypothetical protein
VKNYNARLTRLTQRLLVARPEYDNLIIGQLRPGQQIDTTKPVIWLPAKEEMKNG